MSITFSQPKETGFIQESANNEPGFTDFLDGKFSSFDPAAIAAGNKSLKSGVFNEELESGPLALGYKQGPGTVGNNPGRFM